MIDTEIDIAYTDHGTNDQVWWDLWVPLPIQRREIDLDAERVRETLRDGAPQPKNRIIRLGATSLQVPFREYGYQLRTITCRARPATGIITPDVAACMQSELAGVAIGLSYGTHVCTKHVLVPNIENKTIAIPADDASEYLLAGATAIVTAILPPEWEASRVWQVGLLLTGEAVCNKKC